MKLLKKSVAYVLAFVTVFSSFTILPSEFFNMADVSAVELTTEEPSEVETNQDEITVEEPTTVETTKDEIAVEKTIAVENNKAELPVATSNAVETATEEPTQEKTYTEGDFTYSIINDDEVKIVKYISTELDTVVYIPDVITDSKIPELQNKKITIIGEKAFEQSKIRKIFFGKNIVSIESYAFNKCYSLTKADFSKCVNLITIGDCAFADNTALRHIDLSASTKLTTIGDSAFNNLNRVEKVVLPAGTSLKTIGDYAFHGNGELTEIDLSVCKGLTTIGNHAFSWDSKLSSDLYLENIEIIGHNAFQYCYKIKYVEIGTKLKAIGNYAFYSTYNLETVVIKGGNNGEIFDFSFPTAYNSPTVDINERLGVQYLTIGDGVTFVGKGAFCQCGLKKVSVADTVTTINSSAFRMVDQGEITIGTGVTKLEMFTVSRIDDNCFVTIKLLSKNVTSIEKDSLPVGNADIYCHQGSETHKSLVKAGYASQIKFFNPNIMPIDIKVNDVSIKKFNAEYTKYTVIVDDISKVNITPVFEESGDIKYEVTSENDVYTLNIFNIDNLITYTYNITVREKVPEAVCTVTGDVTLMLDRISYTKVGGSIALPAGTYNLKITKNQQQLGYKKIVADYCGGLTLSEKFTSYITLNATGGTYTFQFDLKTNQLVIKYDKKLPKEYLIGDIDTILKPVGDRPLSIGTQQLQAGTYKFKLSIGGKEYGYNKVVNDATSGSLSMNSKYTAQVTLNATGGMYTFVLNTDTNKLIIRHTPTADECTTDVHISGTFDLVLKDYSSDGKDSTIFTGIKHLENGCYTFKVYNYGVAYTAGVIVNNKGERTLSNQYTTPITLNATGGTYQFTFNNETGVLEVARYKYAVIGDINFALLENPDGYVVNAIYLPAGTYNFKIAGDGKEFGFKKTIYGYCDLYLSQSYKSPITLNASGGWYSFTFIPETNKLGVWPNRSKPNYS